MDLREIIKANGKNDEVLWRLEERMVTGRGGGRRSDDQPSVRHSDMHLPINPEREMYREPSDGHGQRGADRGVAHGGGSDPEVPHTVNRRDFIRSAKERFGSTLIARAAGIKASSAVYTAIDGKSMSEERLEKLFQACRFLRALPSNLPRDAIETEVEKSYIAKGGDKAKPTKTETKKMPKPRSLVETFQDPVMAAGIARDLETSDKPIRVINDAQKSDGLDDYTTEELVAEFVRRGWKITLSA